MSPAPVPTLLWPALWTAGARGPTGKAPSLAGYTAGHSSASVPLFLAPFGLADGRHSRQEEREERDVVTDSGLLLLLWLLIPRPPPQALWVGGGQAPQFCQVVLLLLPLALSPQLWRRPPCCMVPEGLIILVGSFNLILFSVKGPITKPSSVKARQDAFCLLLAP